MEEMELTKAFRPYGNIQLVKPLGYFEFITLLKSARVVVTDSGGVQEESFIFGRRTVTLRKTTEWPETVILGYNHLVDPEDVSKAVNIVLKSVELPEQSPPQLSTCPLGDGNAGRRIARVLRLLTEVKIERGLEASRYPLVCSTTKVCGLTLGFKNRSLSTREKSKYLDKIFTGKENLTIDKEISKVIKVDWMRIDKSVEEL